MIAVRVLGPVVNEVQEFTLVQKFQTLTEAYEHLQSSIDPQGYALAVTNIGFPWCNRQGKIVAYIDNI